MIGRTNIGAWTPVGANSPQFVSVNQYAHVIEIIVRSPAEEDGKSGPTAVATMSHSQFDGLLARLLESRKMDAALTRS